MLAELLFRATLVIAHSVVAAVYDRRAVITQRRDNPVLAAPAYFIGGREMRLEGINPHQTGWGERNGEA